MPSDREPLMTEEEAAIGDRPIPTRAHPRAIRWGDWLVKRTSKTMVRVTSPMGYLDVPLSGPHKVSDATSAAADEVRSGETRWMPVPSRSGSAGDPSTRRTEGLRRVEAWLSPEADAARERLVGKLGSTRAALEWALTQAPEP